MGRTSRRPKRRGSSSRRCADPLGGALSRGSFLNPTAQASAHLVIAADGAVTQCAPFNVVTWHAGRSQWKGLHGLNQFSIGIEIVNGGRLERRGEKWTCPVDKVTIPDDDVVMAMHKNETQVAAWHEYTSKQLEVSLQIAAALVSHYGLQDVLGHDDISPMRKSDPGPAFPMSSFRAKAMGRKDDTMDEYVTADKLNIRSGAGTQVPLTWPHSGFHVHRTMWVPEDDRAFATWLAR